MPGDCESTQTLSFDASGEGLWASGETEKGHRVCLLDPEGLTPLASAEVEGDVEGTHDLLAHPTLPVMGVSVSCGQDGTWLTFVRREGGRLVRLGGLAGPNEPCGHFGFSPDGEVWAGSGAQSVRLWRFPSGEPVAEYREPEDRMLGDTGLEAHRRARGDGPNSLGASAAR